MSRIFITGSSDGLGLLAAKKLIEDGHQVVLHARNSLRAFDTELKVPLAEEILTADLSSIGETIQLAEKVNSLGNFDTVIHNAGVYKDTSVNILNINTLAPYILTALIKKPKRLIYLSSGLHKQGRAKLDYIKSNIDRITYSDSKLHILMLAKIVANNWTNVFSNSVDPGWVPTRMGGKNAPDDLQKGYETQVWLATSDEKEVLVSGKYFYHKKEASYNPEANDIELQYKFLEICYKLTGINFPVKL